MPLPPPVPPSLLEELDPSLLKDLTREEYDALPFGVIHLDSDCRVVTYNAAEALLAKREVHEVVGKHFFTEVAPCMNVAGFSERLAALAAAGGGTEMSDFTFRFPWGQRRVRIRLVVSPATASTWLLVTPVLVPGPTSAPTPGR
jgi:photoactive yellow protein